MSAVPCKWIAFEFLQDPQSTQVNYSYIAKVETLAQDWVKIRSKVNQLSLRWVVREKANLMLKYVKSLMPVLMSV